MVKTIFFLLLSLISLLSFNSLRTASGILGWTWGKSQVWLQHYWKAMDKMFPGPAHNLGVLPKRRVKVQTAIPQSRHPHHDWGSHLRNQSYDSVRTMLYSQSPGDKNPPHNHFPWPNQSIPFFLNIRKAGFGTVQHATVALSFTVRLLGVINFKYHQLL